MVFLILLALAFGGALIVFLLVVGLFEAPWPLLLAGLLLAFVGLQRLSAQAEEASLVIEPEAETASAARRTGKRAKPMGDELVYRGIRYTHVETTSEADKPAINTLEGTYRGKHWQRSASPAAGTDNSDEIVYRGCRVRKSSPRPSDPA